MLEELDLLLYNERKVKKYNNKTINVKNESIKYDLCGRRHDSWVNGFL